MAKVKVYLDPVGNTMNIWWADPNEAHSSEETASSDNNDVVIKNKRGIPIGVELIGVFPEELNIIKLFQKRFPGLSPDEPHFIKTSEVSK